MNPVLLLKFIGRDEGIHAGGMVINAYVAENPLYAVELSDVNVMYM
jgi:hypothetical protein